MSELTSTLMGLFKDSTIPLALMGVSAVLLIGFRRARPSALSLLLMLVPLPLFVLSAQWPWVVWLAWMYTPALMVLLMIDGLICTPPPHKLSLSRNVPAKLSVGRKATVELRLTNQSAEPLTVQLLDSPPPELTTAQALQAQEVQVPPSGQATLSYEIQPTQRGKVRFGKIHARYRSRLGLLWVVLKGGEESEIVITPDLHRIRQMRVQASRAVTPGELQKRTLGLEGTRFSGLRHYLGGDDIKKMAWQATAKLGQPVVRTFEPEVEQPILVLLDAGRKMSSWTHGLCKYDWALNAALALMSVAIDRKDDVGAVVFSNRVIAQVSFGKGASQWRLLLERLSETQVEHVEPDYVATLRQVARGLKRRTLVILLTDLIDTTTSAQLTQGLTAFSNHHTLLVATLSDQQLWLQAQHKAEDAYAAYQKGVAMDLLSLREKTLGRLARYHRATIIDALPGRLDEALIRQYALIKKRMKI